MDPEQLARIESKLDRLLPLVPIIERVDALLAKFGPQLDRLHNNPAARLLSRAPRQTGR